MTTKLAKAKSKAMNYRAEYKKLKEKNDALMRLYEANKTFFNFFEMDKVTEMPELAAVAMYGVNYEYSTVHEIVQRYFDEEITQNDKHHSKA